MRLLLLSLLLIAATASASPADEGRYRIYSVDTHVTGSGETFVLAVVFMVDTQTGATWRYVNRQAEGKAVEGWFPVDYFVPDSPPVSKPADPPATPTE